MKVGGVPHRSIWRDGEGVAIIDQTRLPFEFALLHLSSCDQAAVAIRTMQVRGAPLIGATAAFGLALAMAADPSDRNLADASRQLAGTRPTAVNLGWGLERMRSRLAPLHPDARAAAAWNEAQAIADEDVATNQAIGRHGLPLLQAIAARKQRVNVLTHCNAGWLATVDAGTALAPVYLAHDRGIPVHVWVDETRPRNQGVLTAWELAQHGVPNTLVADNAGGHLMQRGEVDVVIVGADRVSRNGDACNKIGTYLKALAARDCDVPFYVALPGSTIDWNARDAVCDIPIEQRNPRELLDVRGRLEGRTVTVDIGPPGVPAANPAFDVTPARLVTGLITERGVAPASTEGLAGLYRERAA